MAKLAKNKWEIIAQRLAFGDTRAQAHVKAGYRSKNATSDCCSLLRRHPEILARQAELQEEIIRHQTDRQLIGKVDVVEGLLENITAAKVGKEFYDKQGNVTASSRDFAAINQAYKLLADIEGLIVRRSEKKDIAGDPVGDASAAELIQLIDGAFTKLGFDFDLTQLAEVFGSPAEAGESGDPDGPPEVEVLPALPKATREPQGRLPQEIPLADGGESSREIGVGVSGDVDAPDGTLSGLVGRKKVH